MTGQKVKLEVGEVAGDSRVKEEPMDTNQGDKENREKKVRAKPVLSKQTKKRIHCHSNPFIHITGNLIKIVPIL